LQRGAEIALSCTVITTALCHVRELIQNPDSHGCRESRIVGEHAAQRVISRRQLARKAVDRSQTCQRYQLSIDLDQGTASLASRLEAALYLQDGGLREPGLAVEAVERECPIQQRKRLVELVQILSCRRCECKNYR